MAIRQRGPKSYEVYYRDPGTGKIVSRSYKTETEAEKENARVSYLLRYDRARLSEETKTTQDDRQNTTTQTQQAKQEEARTLEAAFVAYLASKDFTPTRIKNQFSTLRPILSLCGTLPLDDVTPVLIEDIKDKLLASDTSRATTNARLRLLRTVLYYAMAKGWRKEFRFPAIPGPQYKHFIPPSPEEIESMYQAAPPHIRRVIILGAYCGVRIGACELQRLTWADVDLQKRVLRVHGSHKNENAPYREVPIREKLVAIFAEWQREDLSAGSEYLISYEGKPIRSIKTAWQTMLKKAGITRRIRPYDLRHAFGTELVAQGVDVGTVAKLMGHSSPIMLLKHYQYVLDRQKVEAVEKLPPLKSVWQN